MKASHKKENNWSKSVEAVWNELTRATVGSIMIFSAAVSVKKSYVSNIHRSSGIYPHKCARSTLSDTVSTISMNSDVDDVAVIADSVGTQRKRRVL